MEGEKEKRGLRVKKVRRKQRDIKFRREIEIFNEKFVNQTQSDRQHVAFIKEQSLKLENMSKILDDQIELNEEQSKKINNSIKVLAQQSKLIKLQALFIEKKSDK